ncbi:MAG: hypothetical protein LAN83_06755 [Acidobacteriia bacterium]|nr:hypothetical protein [Terriglobia bacterium]
MDASYIFLCGMVWSQFGEEDAGLELIRALGSPEQEMRVLARAMLDQAGEGSKELMGQALAQQEISLTQAFLYGFESDSKSRLKARHAGVWFPAASA